MPITSDRFTDLPVEHIEAIFAFATVDVLNNFSLVNKRYHKLAQDELQKRKKALDSSMQNLRVKSLMRKHPLKRLTKPLSNVKRPWEMSFI